MTTPDVSAVPPAPTSSASIWEDFVDIFYAPSKVFERRRGSGFGIQLLVLIVLVTILAFALRPVMQPVMDAEFSRQMDVIIQKNPNVSRDQLQGMFSMTQKFFVVMAPFMTAILVFVIGFVLFLVGKLFDAKESVSEAFLIATYAFFPRLLESVVNLIQGHLIPAERLDGHLRLSLGVGRFLDPATASPLMVALLGRVDVFTIWVTVLLAIGLRVLGGVERNKAIVAGVIMWVLGALPAVLGALRAP